MTINFYPERRGKSSTRKVMVYLREKQAGFQYNPNIKVDIDKWEKNKQRVRRSHQNSLQINNALQNIKIKIDGIYAKYKSEYPLGSFEEFKPYFKEIIKRPNIDIANIEDEDYKHSILLLDAFQEYIDINHKLWKDGTTVAYRSVRRVLGEFQEYVDRKYYLSDINYNFYEKLHDYLVNQRLNANRSITDKIKVLHAFLAWAKKKDYIETVYKNPIKIKSKTSRAIALTKEELTKLYEHKFDNSLHSKVRDIFCFACFTAGRYSDVKTIKWEHITKDSWKYRSPKTGKYIVVPLQKEALAILEKSKGEVRPFPNYRLDKINPNLKEACKEVGIDTPTVRESAIGGKITEETVPKYEMISFHTGRRTFATLAFNAGVPPSIIMKITGHGSIAMFMTYIKTTTEQVKEEFNGAWF